MYGKNRKKSADRKDITGFAPKFDHIFFDMCLLLPQDFIIIQWELLEIWCLKVGDLIEMLEKEGKISLDRKLPPGSTPKFHRFSISLLSTFRQSFIEIHSELSEL
jgi:hypothetical protein